MLGVCDVTDGDVLLWQHELVYDRLEEGLAAPGQAQESR